jgi:predicted Rossmann fold nucleotide-binding protein DprA/Smf involved in DNA uptake
MIKEAAYWITLAHDLPVWSFSNKDGWKNENINKLITKFFCERKISVSDFFHLPERDWKIVYQLTDRQINDLTQAKNNLSDNASLADILFNKGMEIIPVVSPDYSNTLKNSLQESTPPVLYTKGNKQLMLKESITVTGSRDVSEQAMLFAGIIVELACKENKVVVSGAARGIDKYALDALIEYQGQSIVVLPHGISIFFSGIKTYHNQMMDGDMLFLSAFPPKAGWSAGLAMARNPVIYGLASEIYVAESSDTDPALDGIIEASKTGKTVFVRKPDDSEKNTNNLLIQNGAIVIDYCGDGTKEVEIEEEEIVEEPFPSEPELEDNRISFEDEVRKILSYRPSTVKEILQKLNLDWSDKRMIMELKKLDFIRKEKNRHGIYYELRGVTLFD